MLLEKDSTTPSPPASLSKLMTLYMVFEQLKQGKLSLDDKFVVSRKAWKMGGSKMFVEVDKRVRVEDLVRGIVVPVGQRRLHRGRRGDVRLGERVRRRDEPQGAGNRPLPIPTSSIPPAGRTRATP